MLKSTIVGHDLFSSFSLFRDRCGSFLTTSYELFSIQSSNAFVVDFVTLTDEISKLINSLDVLSLGADKEKYAAFRFGKSIEKA